MARDFIPTREAELVTFSTNFKNLITASPTTYGLTAAQATAYGTKHTAWTSAYQTATDPSTRSPSAIIAKDVAKKNVIGEIRMLARIVQATPAVTAQQKSDLGITVRDTDPTPIPPPASAPGISIISAVVRTVRIRLEEAGSTRRGKPDGVAGAAIFSYVGENAPALLADWKFEGNTTRTSFDVLFEPTVAAGAKVWVTACWFNPRTQNGPSCPPISTNIPGGAAQAA